MMDGFATKSATSSMMCFSFRACARPNLEIWGWNQDQPQVEAVLDRLSDLAQTFAVQEHVHRSSQSAIGGCGHVERGIGGDVHLESVVVRQADRRLKRKCVMNLRYAV